MHTHLSIEACCHRDDVTSLVVNGEHVGGGALGVLREDLVSQHPIGSFWIILVHRCHCHHKGSCRETHTSQHRYVSEEEFNTHITSVCICVCVCVGTRLGSLRYRAVEDGVCELWSVVVLIDDIDDDVDGVLHLISVQIHSVCSQLYTQTRTHTHAPSG